MGGKDVWWGWDIVVLLPVGSPANHTPNCEYSGRNEPCCTRPVGTWRGGQEKRCQWAPTCGGGCEQQIVYTHATVCMKFMRQSKIEYITGKIFPYSLKLCILNCVHSVYYTYILVYIYIQYIHTYDISLPLLKCIMEEGSQYFRL